MKNNRIVSLIFLMFLICLYSGCRNRGGFVAAPEPAASTSDETATITTTIIVTATITTTLTSTVTATATTPAVPVLKQSNTYPDCRPTPFQKINAQIITANASYTITRADVALVNCGYYGVTAITGTVRAQIQGVKAGPNYDVPDGIVLANGVSTNTFDVSALTVSPYACTIASFYFPGCAVNAGQKYSLVLYGDLNDPDLNLRINNNFNYGPPTNYEFLFSHDGINWNSTNNMEYYIYQ